MRPQWRQVAWLLLMVAAVSGVSADERVGRLFSTPAERVELDLLRRGLIKKKVLNGAVGEVGENVPPPVAAEPLVLNGLVRRSDGRTTVWVNGQRLEPRGGNGKVTLHGRADRSNRVKLRLSKEPKNIRLKPGQAWDPMTRKVIERYRTERENPEQKLTADVNGGGHGSPAAAGP